MPQRFLIIGASHAAAELVINLRQQGFDGEVLVIGEEAALPYHRPPLSKEYVTGKKTELDLLIRPPEMYSKHDVHFMLNARVTGIDAQRREVTVVREGEQSTLPYDKLALCTGSRVRRLELPGSELEGIFYMRTLADAQAIKNAAQSAKRAVIVGGGYIGLESAAMLRQFGVEVSVLEMAPRLLARVTAPEVAAFYQRVHGEEGVEIFTNVMIESFVGEALVGRALVNKERVSGVRLGDGRLLEADLVIVGVGVLPNVELAEQAGLTVDNGIVVDEYAQTSDPHIVAAGDCTNHPDPIYGRVRLESVPNAQEQAKTAAATLCGKQRPHHSLPWFWSDQYDMKLQIAGLSRNYDRIVIRGDHQHKRSFATFYLKDNHLIAADCINRPKEFMFARRCVGKVVDSEKLADEGVDLKSLV